ncbi:MAG: cell division ATP-binding protein FtsE [bacterium]|uniref:Cell division ATP-binding protein FtsE n=2 Tax=Bacteria candidate phyla TaxID=1783234 RepID=A0A101I066_UNCT6|nr:MAG: Cell division ATP-binding protein FtsE [candidate division TA06 bacterium 32_111]KUK86612.1 MAG: Cell division ATP-binding protein FtsE [candidate division TA06 bacterium 34_109]MDI6701225.1 cell division ATP-binding protein FtsE [bacterium]HAF07848.1 cell division ATP-binding protein FtsE [candidate division WOR-3 bacterium]HCP17366.1 cell division ATP-binding protein FtsE [candidate division WOR-3 bacterium]
MIEFRNVSKYYKNNWLALNKVNLFFEKGQFYYLIGKSGAGKSTILKMIYMDIFPSEGEVIVGNYSSKTIKQNEIPLLRRKIGVIFQDFKLLKDRNVYDNVAFALQVIGERYQNIRKKTLEALSLVRISHKRNSFPYQLSGGEQQKVAIARALVKEPFILVADEPTGNVDPEGTKEIMEILFDINTKGTAILMATHDYSLIKTSIGKVVGLREGKIVKPEDIFKLDLSGRKE